MGVDGGAGDVLPDKAAIEYGRNVVGHLIEKYKRFEQESRDAGRDEAAARWRHVHLAMTRDLYGFDDGGCVIVAFDKRWLDDKWRAWYSGVTP